MTTGDVWNIATAVLTALGGGAIIVFALSSWLGKVWAERIAATERAKQASELEAYKGELERITRRAQGLIDRTTAVHRVQFEAEFAALREIWAKVAVVRLTMAAVRPTVDLVDPDETAEERLAAMWERARTFFVAYNALLDSIEAHSPFYPAAIYAAFEALRQTANHETVEVRLGQPFATDWFTCGRENGEQFSRQMAEAARLIRERLAGLTVIEEVR